jgi:recombination protein RecT
MAETVSQAVEVRDQESKMDSFLEQYQPRFAEVLPAHVKPETFMRLATGAFRKNPDLLQAARNDPAALLNALSEAARKGLEPGTEQYYLLTRKEKGVAKVQGLEGYQGIVERMYRAGYVSSVIVMAVRENDEFTFVPGEDDRPHHRIDWFGDRGALKGVYAYANMRDGAVSNVVVLNRQQVMEAKAKSPGANSQYSPWQTFEEQMWLKTGARRLEKWVPVSNSIRAFGTRPATWAGEHSSFGSDTGNARVTVQAELVEADDDNTLHYEPEDGE